MYLDIMANRNKAHQTSTPYGRGSLSKAKEWLGIQKRKAGDSQADVSVSFKSPPIKMRNLHSRSDSEESDSVENSSFAGHVKSAIDTTCADMAIGHVSQSGQKKKDKKKSKQSGSSVNSNMHTAPSSQVSEADGQGLSRRQISEIMEIVNLSMGNLITNIVDAIKEAVSVPEDKIAGIEQSVDSIREEVQQVKSELDQMKALKNRDKVLSVIEKDDEDQKARARNVIVSGIKEGAEEKEDDLKAAVREIANLADAPIQHDFTVHRIGKKRERKNRVVAVTFSDKVDKVSLMDKKKKLKQRQEIKEDVRFEDKVVVFEDLTNPRQKLLKAVWDLPSTDFAFAKEGAILRKEKDGPFTKIENADDLFKLGVLNVTYKDFYDGVK